MVRNMKKSDSEQLYTYLQAYSKHQSRQISFLDFLNTRQKNIKFTIEKEQDQKLPFLDALITKTSNNRITTNYKIVNRHWSSYKLFKFYPYKI